MTEKYIYIFKVWDMETWESDNLEIWKYWDFENGVHETLRFWGLEISEFEYGVVEI